MKSSKSPKMASRKLKRKTTLSRSKSRKKGEDKDDHNLSKKTTLMGDNMDGKKENIEKILSRK